MAVKIIKAITIASEKKIVLMMESDAPLCQEEIQSMRQKWSEKLNCPNVEIDITYTYMMPPDLEDSVHVDFSKEAYLAAQQKRSGGNKSNQNPYYGAGAKKGYSNKGDGKYNKKKALTPAEGEEPKKDRDGNVIFMGNSIDQEITKMEDLTYDSGFVAVEGKIFDFDSRELKSGSHSVTFAMTDNTYSVKIQF